MKYTYQIYSSSLRWVYCYSLINNGSIENKEMFWAFFDFGSSKSTLRCYCTSSINWLFVKMTEEIYFFSLVISSDNSMSKSL